MPRDADSLPAPARTTTVTIGRKVFQFPLRYSSGHVCSATEAAVLNQALFNAMKHSLDARGGRPAQTVNEEEFVLLAKRYQFNPRSSLRQFSEDPAMAEAARLARNALMESLRANHINPEDRGEEWLEQATQELLARQPSFYEEAQTRLASRRSTAAKIIGEL